ncbi:MAG: GNAT family N-acetyltransferase [Microthrixaceae bacterium]
MIIRPATAEDTARLTEIHVESWRAAYRGQLLDEYLDSLAPEQRVPLWQRVLASTDWPTQGTLVLDCDGEAVGFAHLIPSRDDDQVQPTGEVASMYLDPRVWRQGGGRLLMAAALDALATSYGEATLWVLEANVGPRRFYEATGWTPDDARKTIEIGGLPLIEVRYRIKLPIE